MAFCDFDLKKVKAEFKLQIVENEDLFSDVEAIEISDFLQ